MDAQISQPQSHKSIETPTLNIIDDFPYPVRDAGLRLGKGVTSMYGLINKQQIAAIKLGAQTRIMGHELRRYLESAPAYKAEA